MFQYLKLWISSRALKSNHRIWNHSQYIKGLIPISALSWGRTSNQVFPGFLNSYIAITNNIWLSPTLATWECWVILFTNGKILYHHLGNGIQGLEVQNNCLQQGTLVEVRNMKSWSLWTRGQWLTRNTVPHMPTNIKYVAGFNILTTETYSFSSVRLMTKAWNSLEVCPWEI